MANRYLLFLLRFTKGLTGVFVIMAAFLTLSLCGKMVDAASQPEVQSALDTKRPNIFEAWHETQAGFTDGLNGRHRPERGPLPARTAASFDVQAYPYAQVLRYREPSDAKRMLLQVLGAEALGIGFKIGLQGRSHGQHHDFIAQLAFVFI